MGRTKLERLLYFLRHSGLEALEKKYSIIVRQHSLYPNLYLLKYNQIESNISLPMVQACRGIIVDKDNDWKPVCYPYNKFFNYLETHAFPVNWANSQVFEKLDGSLCQLYYYNDMWHIATSGSPDASGSVNMGEFTFKELFWRVWKELDYDLPKQTDKCYFFELMTKHNRIVISHPNDRLVLHGARDMNHYQELWPQQVVAEQNLNWEVVQTYNFNSKEEVLDNVANMNGLEQEGFVVCDRNFNRVKVKCKDYVRLHYVVSGMTTRKMLQIIQKAESEEWLVHFGEWRKIHNQIKAVYERAITETEELWKRFGNIKEQKVFAMHIKDLKHFSALFSIRSGKARNARDFYSKMHIKRLEEFLNLQNVVLNSEE